MKARFFKAAAFLLAVTLFLAVFFNPGIGSGSKNDEYPIVAKAVTYVGNCGENCKWTLDLRIGLLSVDGKGAMNDYEEKCTAPWYKYREQISKITVSGKIKKIGNYAFSCLDKAKTVSICDFVTEIGEGAFLGCASLGRIVAGSSSKLMTIGDSAFAYCRRLSGIPEFSSLSIIGKKAFYYCYSLSNVTLGYSVLTVGDGAFDCCNSLKKVRIVNYDCDIFDSPSVFYKTVCVESFNNSTARAYADKYERKFKRIKDINYLNDLTVKLDSNAVTYTGKKLKPAVLIKGLKNGKDFTVRYRNNKEPGIAGVTVFAAGNSLGEKNLNFKILPKRAENITLESRKTHSLSFSWNTVHGADKYEIFILSGEKWIKKAETGKTAYTAKELSGATKYSFKVRAVTVSGKTKCIGKFSRTFSDVTKPEPTSINKISLIRGGGKLRISVDRVSGANGYEVLMSTKEHGKYKKVAVIENTKKLSAVIDSLNNSDTYYFKVRSFVRNGDAFIYSALSDVRSSGVL